MLFTPQTWYQNTMCCFSKRRDHRQTRTRYPHPSSINLLLKGRRRGNLGLSFFFLHFICWPSPYFTPNPTQRVLNSLCLFRARGRHTTHYTGVFWLSIDEGKYEITQSARSRLFAVFRPRREDETDLHARLFAARRIAVSRPALLGASAQGGADLLHRYHQGDG